MKKTKPRPFYLDLLLTKEEEIERAHYIALGTALRTEEGTPSLSAYRALWENPKDWCAEHLPVPLPPHWSPEEVRLNSLSLLLKDVVRSRPTAMIIWAALLDHPQHPSLEEAHVLQKLDQVLHYSEAGVTQPYLGTQKIFDRLYWGKPYPDANLLVEAGYATPEAWRDVVRPALWKRWPGFFEHQLTLTDPLLLTSTGLECTAASTASPQREPGAPVPDASPDDALSLGMPRAVAKQLAFLLMAPDTQELREEWTRWWEHTSLRTLSPETRQAFCCWQDTQSRFPGRPAPPWLRAIRKDDVVLLDRLDTFLGKGQMFTLAYMGRSPLHHAASRLKTQALTWLLERAPAPLEVDAWGMHLGHIAFEGLRVDRYLQQPGNSYPEQNVLEPVPEEEVRASIATLCDTLLVLEEKGLDLNLPAPAHTRSESNPPKRVGKRTYTLVPEYLVAQEKVRRPFNSVPKETTLWVAAHDRMHRTLGSLWPLLEKEWLDRKLCATTDASTTPTRRRI